MKVKVNDKVIVIAGKDRGKTGKIIKVEVKHNRVVVEKLNMRTKHIRKSANKPGEKIRYEAPIHASNVMILDPKENKPTRVAYKMLDKGKKERISKLSGLSLDNVVNEAETKKKATPATEKEKKTTGASKKKTIKA